ncbi:MAG: elongation factor P [Candidatus Omnitrophica bacterium]|nr:elongation factor P [Candidatus Omnitrophota bacterium]
MGIPIGSIKPSNTIIYNNDLYTIVDCEHAKLGRGSAFCRVKLRNPKTGQTLSATLRDSDNIEMAFIEKKKLQYTYKDNDFYHFMDMETFEDLILNKSSIEETIPWLTDNLELVGIFYEDTLINLEIAPTMVLSIVETEPGIKGDSVKNNTKPATLETGLVIQVPLFINQDDSVKVDTKTKSYMERA